MYDHTSKISESFWTVVFSSFSICFTVIILFSIKNFNVLSIDLPGHGNSEGPCLKSIEVIAEWLEKVFDKLNDHNLKKMLDKKLMVMINSDDPAYFGGYLNKNLIETSKALNLNREDIKKLIENSFKSSFLEKEKKDKWLKKIN